MNAGDLHDAVRFQDDWTLAEDAPQPDDLPYLETIFAQANGYIGMRGSLEEGAPPGADSEPYFVCQGVFDQQPGRYETDELVNLPDWLPIELEMGGARLGSEASAVVKHQRRLSLRDGILTRELTVRLPEGEVYLVFRRLLSQANRHLAAWQMRLAANGTVSPIRLGWGFATDRTNRGTVHVAETHHAAPSPETVLHEVRTLESGITVAQAQVCRMRVDGADAAPRDTREVAGDGFAGIQWAFDADSGREIVVERANAVCTSRDRAEGPPQRRAAAYAFDAATVGFEALAEQTRGAWAEKWARANVRIEGDRTADRALRYCLFQLMQANIDDDDRTAIGAKALSGPGYRGHFFWDTEMFMEPLFAHTDPDAARNLVAFRHRILPGARERARQMGCRGARFPWEATRDGHEQCPRWLPEGDREVRIVTGEREDHITADVAWGARYYYQVTGDDDFWYRQGLELLVAAARFWQSRVEWNEEKDRFEILRVMGPDENHKLVDNNAYTNYLAAWTLETAAETVDRRVREEPWAARLKALGVEANEARDWRRTAAAMYLPLEEQTGIIPQHDGFVKAVRGGEDVQPLKQADVLMLLRLFPDLLPGEAEVRNWELYEPLTEHGSSLSPSVHAMVAARLGLTAEAESYLREALLVDLADTHGNSAEGLHAAALGGAWLAVVQGTGGLWVDSSGGLHLDPSLPEGWERVQLGLCLRGGVLRCRMRPQRIMLSFHHPGGEALEITVAGEPLQLSPGLCHRVALD
ncbi:MAG: glycosyl hydrolase family 65 protein [Armatimonadota bacterium]|nr:glycosyl hydrolase family 65 protein [Armatimonadota bacterium]